MGDLQAFLRDAFIIDAELMGADILPDHVIDLGPGGQKFIALQIKTTQGAALPDHVGVVRWEVANAALDITTFAAKGSYAIVAGAEINQMEDNITTSARFLRVWYDRTSGGDDDTLNIVVHTCAG